MTPAARLAGRRQIAENEAEKARRLKEEEDLRRDTVVSPWDMELDGKKIAAGQRIPTLVFQMEMQRRAQASAEEIADKRIAAAEARATAAARAQEARQAVKEAKDKMAQENVLRNQYNNKTKRTREAIQLINIQEGKYGEEVKAGRQLTPAAQFALIYAFNKALDPTSVVRESEFSNTRRAGIGVHERAFQYLENLRSGAMLTNDQVKEMLDEIQRRRTILNDEMSAMDDEFRDIALQYSIDPAKLYGRQKEEERSRQAPGGNYDRGGVLTEPEKAANKAKTGNTLGLTK